MAKQKKTRNLGLNRSKDHEFLYNYIEKELGIKTKKCGRGANGRLGKFGLAHQGPNPVPIRNFYLHDIYIDPNTKKVVVGKTNGLQGACIACDKAYRAARSKTNNNKYKNLTDEQIRINYIKNYGQFKGCSMCDPDKKRITPNEVGISRGMETGLHNTCLKCARAYTESVSSRWEIVSPDGHHPLKITENHKCRICDSKIKMHKDHIWPLSKGGTDNKDNIQILCQKHNLKKSASISPFDKFLGFNKIKNLKYSMICKRYHPILKKAKSENWDLRKFEIFITKEVKKFIEKKMKMTDDKLLLFFEREKQRNNRKHKPTHALKSFRRYCKQAIFDVNQYIKENQ